MNDSVVPRSDFWALVTAVSGGECSTGGKELEVVIPFLEIDSSCEHWLAELPAF